MNLLERIHDRYIYRRRIRVLSKCMTGLINNGECVLDVGCGDGLLSKRIMEEKPGVKIEGIDVLVRKNTFIPVNQFDGKHIPYDDGSMGIIMLVDVLHHVDDPKALLAEAARVARDAVVLKDHLCDGLLAGPILKLMDRVGNKRHGVRLTYHFWFKDQWKNAFADLDLNIACWNEKIRLYPFPLDLIFGRHLHFTARLEFASSNYGNKT